jgi:hypothetical protein
MMTRAEAARLDEILDHVEKLRQLVLGEIMDAPLIVFSVREPTVKALAQLTTHVTAMRAWPIGSSD